VNDEEPAGTPGTGRGPEVPPQQAIFDRIRTLGIVRPDEGRWAAGVCAGIAHRWALDPVLVRGLFLIAGIVLGSGLGLYGLLWLLLPHPDGRIHAQQVAQGVVTSGFIGAVVCLTLSVPVGGVWTLGSSNKPFSGLGFLVLVGGGIWWLARGRHGGAHAPFTTAVPPYGTPAPAQGAPVTKGPESETPCPAAGAGARPTAVPPAGTAAVAVPRRADVQRPLHSITLGTVGLALVAAGAVIAWDRWGDGVPSPPLMAITVALCVIALGTVLAGLAGHRAGGLAPLGIVLALVTVCGAFWHSAVESTVTDGPSEVTWSPATRAAVPAHGYALDGGRAVLDLTGLALAGPPPSKPAPATGAAPASPLTIPVSQGLGELTIIVPGTVPTRVDADVDLGAISDYVTPSGEEKRTASGTRVTRSASSRGSVPSVVVKAHLGLGHIEIVPEGTEVDR
jgi:phage shock protein PspC (stress-responsive transcriptional regulator)